MLLRHNKSNAKLKMSNPVSENTNAQYANYYQVAEEYPENSGWSWNIFNGLEWTVIVLMVISLLIVIFWGFFVQEAKNRDTQRFNHFTQTIIPSLDGFYANSAATESARRYPIAKCSPDLNEVDFESTLRQSLTGQLPELENHTYIKPKNYPRDIAGTYAKNFSDRKIPYRCTERLTLGILEQKKTIYPDIDSCNFRPSENYKKCYLYTTNGIGDTYQLAYFSEETNCFVTFKKFRSQGLQTYTQC